MTPEIKQAERDRLAADVAAWIAKHGEPETIPAGVSGDTYIERMNAHGKTAADWDRKRLRGAKNGNAAMGKTGKKDRQQA